LKNFKHPDFEAESEVKKYIKGIKDPKKTISQVFEHLDENNDNSDYEKDDMKANTIQVSKDVAAGNRNSVDYRAKSIDSRKNTLQMIANVSRKNTNNSKIEVKPEKLNDLDEKSYKCNSVQLKSIDMRNNLLKDKNNPTKVLKNDIDFKLDENDGYIEPNLRSSLINQEDERDDRDDNYYIHPNSLSKQNEKNNNPLAVSHDDFKPRSSLVNMSFKLDKQDLGEVEYRQEMNRKIIETEKRLLEIESNTKKKLEELVSQVKVYIPINFNSYVKPQEQKQNTIYDNIDQNYCVNVMDSNILQNPGFRGDTNKSVFKKKNKVISQPEQYQRRTQ
jgi:hypothetical protein